MQGTHQFRELNFEYKMIVNDFSCEVNCCFHAPNFTNILLASQIDTQWGQVLPVEFYNQYLGKLIIKKKKRKKKKKIFKTAIQGYVYKVGAEGNGTSQIPSLFVCLFQSFSFIQQYLSPEIV